MRSFNTKMARSTSTGAFHVHGIFSQSSHELPNALGIKPPAHKVRISAKRAPRRIERNRSVIVVNPRVQYQGLSASGKPVWK